MGCFGGLDPQNDRFWRPSGPDPGSPQATLKGILDTRGVQIGVQNGPFRETPIYKELRRVVQKSGVETPLFTLSETSDPQNDLFWRATGPNPGSPQATLKGILDTRGVQRGVQNGVKSGSGGVWTPENPQNHYF